MKILKLAAILLGLSAPASAVTLSPFSTLVISSTAGTATQYLSGTECIAASSKTPSSCTVTASGITGSVSAGTFTATGVPGFNGNGAGITSIPSSGVTGIDTSIAALTVSSVAAKVATDALSASTITLKTATNALSASTVTLKTATDSLSVSTTASFAATSSTYTFFLSALSSTGSAVVTETNRAVARENLIGNSTGTISISLTAIGVSTAAITVATTAAKVATDALSASTITLYSTVGTLGGSTNTLNGILTNVGISTAAITIATTAAKVATDALSASSQAAINPYITTLSNANEITIVGTGTVQGNAFSVGRSTFIVSAGTVSYGGLIKYSGNNAYGTAANTHTNLGPGNTTGTAGQNYSYATVSGGNGNVAAYSYSSVGGGTANTAGGNGSSIGGGNLNVTGPNAQFAAIPGGQSNTANGYASYASGRYSFAGTNQSHALGCAAHSLNAGSFVWGDSTCAGAQDSAANQFIVQATGGFGVNTSTPATTLDVNGSAQFGSGATKSTFTTTGALILDTAAPLSVSSATFVGIRISTQVAGAAGASVTATCGVVGTFAIGGGCSCATVVAATSIISVPNVAVTGGIATGWTCQVAGGTGGACSAYAICSRLQ